METVVSHEEVLHVGIQKAEVLRQLIETIIPMI
jgi:purine nucleoside phosphorylase